MTGGAGPKCLSKSVKIWLVHTVTQKAAYLLFLTANYYECTVTVNIPVIFKKSSLGRVKYRFGKYFFCSLMLHIDYFFFSFSLVISLHFFFFRSFICIKEKTGEILVKYILKWIVEIFTHYRLFPPLCPGRGIFLLASVDVIFLSPLRGISVVWIMLLFLFPL